MLPTTTTLCSKCGSAFAPAALSCPFCGQLVHVQEYEALAQHAKLAGQAGDWQAARAAWQQALEYLPPDAAEYRTVQARIQNIDLQLSNKGSIGKWLAKLGPAGVIVWKFKTFALLALTKGKLVLLGLTKFSTFASMLAFFGVYWAMYGWKFALGFVLSIYIHEMGHVIALRKYSIAATAPMFIPFFGAFIRAKQYPHSVAEDARVGLAGPIWGTGAAIIAWVSAIITGQPIWYAIAHVGAWINLFNLLPVWQLDGGRGFRALTRKQRVLALAAAVAMFFVTGEMMLLLIAAGALYRLFSKDYPPQEDRGALMQYVALIVVLSMLVVVSSRTI